MPRMPRRRNVRLPSYDYSQPGAYFVTICAAKRKPLFGSIVDGDMRYTPGGEIVRDKWAANDDHYPGLSVDEFIVMPNHLHGILMLSDQPDRLVLPIGEIVRRYKSIVAIRLHKEGLVVGDVWQRNYFEHVIRNDRDPKNAREY